MTVCTAIAKLCDMDSPYFYYSTCISICTSTPIYCIHDMLNLRTELFRPLWTRQRSTEEMRPNLVAMKDQISKARPKTYLARVLKLTSQ